MAEDFSFLADPTAFEDVLPKFKADTAEARAGRARGLGYDVNGDQASKNIGGILNTFPLMGTNRFAPAPGEQNSFMNQLGSLLGIEIPKIQSAANRQYQRGAGAISEFSSALTDSVGQINKGAAEQAAPVESFAGRAEGLGGEAAARSKELGQGLLDRTNKDVNAVNASVDKQEGFLDKALGFADASVASAKGAVSGYDASYHEQLKAVVGGLNRKADTVLSQIASSRSPDGTPLSEGEKWQMKRELLHDAGQTTAEAMTGLWDKAQTAMAGLRMGLADVEGRAGQIALGAAGEARMGAQTRLGAASLRAEAGSQAANIEQQGEQSRLAYTQIAGQAREFVASLKNAGMMQGIMAKIQGLQTKYGMIQSNPESIVSIFSALAALAGVATAPGADRVPGLNLGGR